jgi:hypothetical protein
MAANANSARRSVWNTAHEEYIRLTKQLAQCQPNERNVLERAIAAQEEDLLDTPAASLDGVRVKLEILFDGQMTGLDAESEARRLVVEDVHKLATELDDLIGLNRSPQAHI